MRGFVERVRLVSGKALNKNNMTPISDELKVGNGWIAMYIRIINTFTVGTGTTPITEGELLAIKNIRLVTDLGEVICNLPGRAAYKIAQYKTGVAPRKDAIAASNGTYRVTLPIFFSEHPELAFKKQHDTILDTKRYNSVRLEITMGGEADLLGTVGTSAAVFTVDVFVEQVRGVLPKEAQPRYYIEYDTLPTVDASVQQFVLLNRAKDKSIKRLYAWSCSSGTNGVPWSGTAADDVQDLESIEDQSGPLIKDMTHQVIQEENILYRKLAGALVTGLSVHDFVKEKSNEGALLTVGKPLLQYKWTNQAGVAANDVVSISVESIRSIQPY